jgi:hypothetical protein
VTFTDGSGTKQLYEAADIDFLGRTVKARYAGAVDYSAIYADGGRGLMKEATVSSAAGSRRVIYLHVDPAGRERSRHEVVDGALSGLKTSTGYDALGRISMLLQTSGAMTLASWQFSYDALGNVRQLVDATGTAEPRSPESSPA